MSDAKPLSPEEERLLRARWSGVAWLGGMDTAPADNLVAASGRLLATLEGEG